MFCRVGLTGLAFTLLFVSSAIGTLPDPSDRVKGEKSAQGSKKDGERSKAGERPDVGGEKTEADWAFIGGQEVETRSFLVRMGGVNVGAAELTVREFQNRTLYRTGLEYWLFSGGSATDKAYFWFQGFCSEFGDKRPVAIWGTGHRGKSGLSFRLQGDGGWLTVESNFYGEKRRRGERVRPPKGYRVIGQLRVLMRKAMHDGSSTPIEWKRCDWQADELHWDLLKYAYAGKESISTADGARLDAHRFDVSHADGDGVNETVWVDDGALPLRRQVGGEKGFEILFTTGKPKEHIHSFPTWDETVKKLGQSKLDQYLSAVDIAY